jgi:NAD(P)-dependent dehydrogenase (short-subunit alcohol dehydrogenase family)
MALARRFGREGYRVGLLSRSQTKLDGYVKELDGLGIQAAGFAADVCNRPQLAAAIARMKAHFGSIDVLEYSPMIRFDAIHPVLSLDDQTTLYHLEYQVLGAVVAVKAVVDDMIAKGDGALLFTTGASAIATVSVMGDCSIGVAALRHYAMMLNVALASKGVYAGTLCIAAPLLPDALAERYWSMVQKRDQVEEIFGVPELLSAFDALVAGGLAEFYPPRLLENPPPPRNETERTRLILALYYLYIGAELTAEPAREAARARDLAQQLGGDIGLEFFGVKL